MPKSNRLESSTISHYVVHHIPSLYTITSIIISRLCIFLFSKEYTVATKIIRPPVLKIFSDLYLLDKENYRALVFSVL